MLVAVAGAVVAVVVRVNQPQRSTTALCGELSDAQDLDQSFTTLDLTTLGPQVTSLERAARVAPDEIKNQVQLLADFVSRVADTVDTAPDRETALVDALGAAQDEIDAVTAAGIDVQLWAADNCGLDLTGSASSSTTATTSTTVAP